MFLACFVQNTVLLSLVSYPGYVGKYLKSSFYNLRVLTSLNIVINGCYTI